MPEKFFLSHTGLQPGVATKEVTNRFNGFPQLTSETVRNGFSTALCFFTGLKPGVNEKELFRQSFPPQISITYFTGGGYFLNNLAIALFMFFSTFCGSLPEPSVLLASPRQICFLVPTSYRSQFSVPI